MSQSTPSDDSVARIVAAFATRPDVSADQIIDLARRLKTEGWMAGGSVQAATAPVDPAIPVSQAVTQDKVYCLCCGKGFKMLKRHLGAEHGLTEPEYRRMFDLAEDFPLVAPSYSDRKAAYARKAGLGKYSRDAQARSGGKVKAG